MTEILFTSEYNCQDVYSTDPTWQEDNTTCAMGEKNAVLHEHIDLVVNV